MNRFLFLLLSVIIFSTQSFAQDTKIILPQPKFSPGNNDAWKERDFNDASWRSISAELHWERQGYADLDGYSWYRFTFTLPSSLREKSLSRDVIKVCLGYIDDADEAFWNGEKIGKTGRFYDDNGGYQSRFGNLREYLVDANSAFINWDGENVIAVKVLDDNGAGGINGMSPFIQMLDLVEIQISKSDADVSGEGVTKKVVYVKNLSDKEMNGVFTVAWIDRLTGREFLNQKEDLKLGVNVEAAISLELRHEPGMMVEANYVFEDINGKKTGVTTEILPYILTPKAPLEPRINGTDIFGVRANSPFLYKIPASGEKPLIYGVRDLPEGLSINRETGIISGKLSKEGNYRVTFIVENKRGKAERSFDIKCGDLLALTPPMGWNSWNCFGVNVTEEKVRSSAQALIDKGLIDYGWSYMNIDDGWQAASRDENGVLQPNEKFGSIKALGDWMHAHGLKLGIYSSPGPLTCGRFLGSYKYEALDAKTYNEWGIDYLKYDWCGYSSVVENDSLEAYMKPYFAMDKELRKQSRDIIYSLCQYGMKDVWTWGAEVGGNAWRVTGDIEDTWDSLSGIAFRHGVERMSAYAQPGHWNDLDMMIVGQVGWNDNLRKTRLTWDEQYMHVSFWAMQASPLLIGCDMSKLDDFTVAILTNPEVIAINQDRLGEQAVQILKTGDYEIWTKNLSNGDKVVGIFNLRNSFQQIPVSAEKVGIRANSSVRDVWRQKDMDVFGKEFNATVPPHGAVLLRIKK